MLLAIFKKQIPFIHFWQIGENVTKLKGKFHNNYNQLEFIKVMHSIIDTPPSSLCDPKRVQKVGFAEMVRNLVPLPTSSTKRGRGVVLEAPGLD
jgi:hypothetical protein